MIKASPEKWTAISLTAAVGLGALILWFPALASLLLVGSVGVLALAKLCQLTCRSPDIPAGELKRVLIWTITSFFAHLAIGLVITEVSSLRLYFGPDSLTYHDGAISILRGWAGTAPAPALPDGKEGFFYLLAGLYWIFGTHTVAGLAANATLAAGLVPLMTDAARRLFGSEESRFVPAIVVLFPGFLIWPAQLLREAGILFLIALAGNSAVRLSERTRLSNLLTLCAAGVLLFTFRGHVALTVVVTLVIGIMVGKASRLAGLHTGVTAAAMVAAVVIGLGVGYAGYVFAIQANFEKAQNARADLAVSAGSSFDVDADISTSENALAYLPTALTNFLLGPFPWQLGGFRHIPAFVEVGIWWLLAPFLLLGLIRSIRLGGRRIMPLIMPASGLTVMLSLVLSNFGIVLRERMQVFVLLVPFLALGLYKEPVPGKPKRARVKLTRSLLTPQLAGDLAESRKTLDGARSRRQY